MYFDDVGIMGATEAEHDKTLLMVLERARKNGVKFNPEKVQHRQSQVEFMGNVFSDGQVKSKTKYREAVSKREQTGCSSTIGSHQISCKLHSKFIKKISKSPPSNATRCGL